VNRVYKDFQKSACLLQIFPKIPLAVSCDIKGLQAPQTPKAYRQIFCPSGGLEEAATHGREVEFVERVMKER